MYLEQSWPNVEAVNWVPVLDCTALDTNGYKRPLSGRRPVLARSLHAGNLAGVAFPPLAPAGYDSNKLMEDEFIPKINVNKNTC